MDPLSIRDTAVTVLEPLNVDVVTDRTEFGPDGLIRPSVLVTVTTGLATGRRGAGGSVDRDGYVNALVVSTSRDSCLWLSQQVRDSLADLYLGSPHGRLTDASFDGEPVPEPGTSVALWSRALAFTITTKRSS